VIHPVFFLYFFFFGLFFGTSWPFHRGNGGGSCLSEHKRVSTHNRRRHCAPLFAPIIVTRHKRREADPSPTRFTRLLMFFIAALVAPRDRGSFGVGPSRTIAPDDTTPCQLHDLFFRFFFYSGLGPEKLSKNANEPTKKGEKVRRPSDGAIRFTNLCRRSTQRSRDHLDADCKRKGIERQSDYRLPGGLRPRRRAPSGRPLYLEN